jgi:hypothetical protein
LLIDRRDHQEGSAAIHRLAGDCFSSEGGDVQGFRIADKLPNKKPVNPRVQEIGQAVIDRVFNDQANQSLIIEECLSYGDSFRAIVFDREMTRVERLKQLPTWEMFRKEDQDGNIERFEQRRLSGVGDNAPAHILHPLICVHWRHRPKVLYGRALFLASIINGDFDRLDRAIARLDQAAGAIAFDPNLHEFPEGYSDDQISAYRTALENERRKPGKIITDFYMENGGKIGKIRGAAGAGSSLNAMIADVQGIRSRIAMVAQIPGWLLGLPATGAIDIGGQPAVAYARTVNDKRSVYAQGAKQVINLELILNGIPESDRQYQLEFPKIYSSPTQQSAASTDDISGEDEEGPNGGNGDGEDDGDDMFH